MKQKLVLKRGWQARRCSAKTTGILILSPTFYLSILSLWASSFLTSFIFSSQHGLFSISYILFVSTIVYISSLLLFISTHVIIRLSFSLYLSINASDSTFLCSCFAVSLSFSDFLLNFPWPFVRMCVCGYLCKYEFRQSFVSLHKIILTP